MVSRPTFRVRLMPVLACGGAILRLFFLPHNFINSPPWSKELILCCHAYSYCRRLRCIAVCFWECPKSYCPYSRRAKSLLQTYSLDPAPRVIEVDLRGKCHLHSLLLRHVMTSRNAFRGRRPPQGHSHQANQALDLPEYHPTWTSARRL